MTYWHMQLHPANPTLPNDHIRRIVDCGLIGCSGDPVSTFNDIAPDDIVIVRHTNKSLIALVKVISHPRDTTEQEQANEDIWFERCTEIEILKKYVEGRKITSPGFFYPTTVQRVSPDAEAFVKELLLECQKKKAWNN